MAFKKLHLSKSLANIKMSTIGMRIMGRSKMVNYYPSKSVETKGIAFNEGSPMGDLVLF